MALARTGQPSAVEVLEGFLPVVDRRLQARILEGLEAGTDAATAAVARAAGSGDERLRLIAARALAGD